MKIRIAITSPRGYSIPGYAIWDVNSIDEFKELFIKDNTLVVDELKITIGNLQKHNEYVATFNIEHVDMPDELKEDGMCPYRYAYLELIQAFLAHNAPEGRAALHNIKIESIPDDYDPLKSPRAEATRRGNFQLQFLSTDYFGNPGYNTSDIRELQLLIQYATKCVENAACDLQKNDDPDNIKAYAFKIYTDTIDLYKNDYADAKKELRDYGVETISDCAQFDDYYDEKYGNII